MVPWIAVSTARRIFLFGCLLPTLAVISWAAVHGLPGRSVRVSRSLSRDLRMVIHVDGDSTPRPGLSHFARLEASHPVTRERLVVLEDLSIARQGETCQIHGPRLVVESHALPHLASWFQSLVMDTLSRPAGSWKITIESAELRHGAQVWSLGAFVGTVAIRPSHSEVRVGFCRAGVHDADPGIKIAGDVLYVSQRPSCRWDVEVHDNDPEPAVLLSALSDGVSLGADARWSGHLRWHSEFGAPWSAGLQGRISQVALDHLTNSALTGAATIDVESCRFSALGLQDCVAVVRAAQGEVDDAWLAAWIDSAAYRGGTVSRNGPTNGATLPFSNLAAMLSYAADSRRWSVGPLADPADPATALPILRRGDSEQVWLQWTDPRELPPFPHAP